MPIRAISSGFGTLTFNMVHDFTLIDYYTKLNENLIFEAICVIAVYLWTHKMKNSSSKYVSPPLEHRSSNYKNQTIML